MGTRYIKVSYTKIVLLLFGYLITLNMKFDSAPSSQEKSSERHDMKGKYSLEKWRAAPAETLDAKERAFIEEYQDRMDAWTERARENPSLARALLREAVRPDLWHTLLNMSNAEAILDKQAESKEGQMGLAQEEAEEMNEKYEQLREEMEDAVANLAAFIDEANGHEEGVSTTAPIQKKNETGETLH